MLNDTCRFRQPAVHELLLTAAHILKFRFPVSRNRLALERLVQRCIQHPKLSKNAVKEIPLPVLEEQAQRLFHTFVPDISPEQANQNRVFSLYLMMEDCLQFNPTAWVKQDIEALGLLDGDILHGSFYQTHEHQPQALTSILMEHGYQTDFLEGASSTAEVPSDLLYLTCRHLTHPFPWVSLLEKSDCQALLQMPSEDLPNNIHPRQMGALHKLSQIHHHLSTCQAYQALSITPDTLAEALKKLSSIITSGHTLQGPQKLIRPVYTLALVEGATEEILLPPLAKCLGFNFLEQGVLVLPAGGKNQVLQLYRQYKTLLNIPMVVVLDQDAEEIHTLLQQDCRLDDILFLLPEGEFEDIYDPTLLAYTINTCYQPHLPVHAKQFQTDQFTPPASGRSEQLKVLWRELGLGDFEKTKLAKNLSTQLLQISQKNTTESISIPPSVQTLLEQIDSAATRTKKKMLL
ncbi:MAG: ATP-dependent endonuclease [Vampirovibrio sp.]|nr:ATP-dependent endonuclease [Vampirovibrio sp.]